MFRMLDRRVVSWLVVGIALMPAVLYAVLGQFSRMTSDDYVHLQRGLEFGPWANMLHWRDAWNGSYSYYFVHGLVARWDTLVPSLTAIFIIVTWSLGLGWLVWQILAFMEVKRYRSALAISLAALCVAASINAFYSPQSMYWFSASVRYTFPLAVFTVYLALMVVVAKRLRSNARLALSTLAAAAICFISAGFAETYLVYQLVFLSLMLTGLYVFVARNFRWKAIALIGGAWLGTVASLVVQWTAPGLSIRTELKLQYEWFEPIRDLPNLAGITLNYMYQLALNPDTIVSFLLLFTIGMYLSLGNKVTALPTNIVGWHKPGGGKPLYLAALIVQLVFVPVIWTHSSNDGTFFGRFSQTYMLVVIINIVLIAGLLLLIWRYRQLRAFLQTESTRWRSYVLAMGLCALTMLAAPRIRDIHLRAEYFLLFTAVSFLVVAWWEWASNLRDPVDKRLCLLAAASTVATMLIFAAGVSVGQFFIGQLELRSLSFVSFLLVLQGLVWGFAMGQSIRLLGTTGRKRLQFICAAVFVVAYASIVIGQIRLIPDFARFASEWDERHALLLDLKSRGQTQVELPRRAFALEAFLFEGRIEAYTGKDDPMDEAMLNYYGFEAISVAESG